MLLIRFNSTILIETLNIFYLQYFFTRVNDLIVLSLGSKNLAGKKLLPTIIIAIWTSMNKHFFGWTVKYGYNGYDGRVWKNVWKKSENKKRFMRETF